METKARIMKKLDELKEFDLAWVENMINHLIARTAQPPEPARMDEPFTPQSGKWFGKGCQYQCCQWEGNYETDGPDYKEAHPVLIFCNHKKNEDGHEGNCGAMMCPRWPVDDDRPAPTVAGHAQRTAPHGQGEGFDGTANNPIPLETDIDAVNFAGLIKLADKLGVFHNEHLWNDDDWPDQEDLLRVAVAEAMEKLTNKGERNERVSQV